MAMNHTTHRQDQRLDTAYTPDEVRNATPEKRSLMWRVVDLMRLSGVDAKLARQAVEQAEENEQ